MAVVRTGPTHSTDSTSVADLLERVLDKGVVIAGDVKVSLLDIELLTIQIRLVVCSVDKAKEMGMDWWANSPVFSPGADSREREKELAAAEERVRKLEASLEDRLRTLELRDAEGGDAKDAAGGVGERRFKPVRGSVLGDG